MYQISFHEVIDILKNHHLLREIVHHGAWTYCAQKVDIAAFTSLTYNSVEAKKQSLFFCKGLNFKETYLDESLRKGVEVYIAEELYSRDYATAIIVSDVRKAMALIAQAFYNYPQDQLTLVGITGTKGKTTTTYFTRKALQSHFPNQTAIISTIDVNLDGKHSTPSNLTTPEAIDLYAMIAQAVENGMKYLVMEVSSQAYKTDRVYQLTFDIGVFLNISPDHIGPNEHPSFEDYFYCKRQLLDHSNTALICSGSDYAEFLIEYAQEVAQKVYVFGRDSKLCDFIVNSDYQRDVRSFEVEALDSTDLGVGGSYRIQLLGEFNKDNALAAILVAGLAGAPQESIKKGLEKAVIPGRMEHFQKNSTNIYVDFAHNFISLKTLLEFAVEEHPEAEITVITGAPGGKGVSRREDMGKVLDQFNVNIVLTEDDPNFDSPKEIANQILEHIHDKSRVEYIESRTQAIEKVITEATDLACLLIIGKGNDQYMIRKGRKESYEGDAEIVKKLLNQ